MLLLGLSLGAGGLYLQLRVRFIGCWKKYPSVEVFGKIGEAVIEGAKIIIMLFLTILWPFLADSR